MKTPFYLEAPEADKAKPSFWQRLSAGIDRTPSESFYGLATALSSPGNFGTNLASGLASFGKGFADMRKRQSLASAFDSMAADIPATQRPIFEQMVQNNPEALMGMAAERMFAKPAEQWKGIDVDGDGRNDFQQSSLTGEFKDLPRTLAEEERLRRAGASRTSVNVGGGSEKQIFDVLTERFKQTAPIMSGMNSLQEARKLVEEGGLFGAGADIRVGAAKVVSLLTGTPVDPRAVNTESFRGAIAPLVGATLKATSGTSQLSEGELRFAERAAAGDINMDPASIKKVLNILDKAMRNTAQDYNRRLDAVYPKGTADRSRSLFELNLEPAAPVPAAPRVLNYNPRTGRTE